MLARVVSLLPGYLSNLGDPCGIKKSCSEDCGDYLKNSNRAKSALLNTKLRSSANKLLFIGCLMFIGSACDSKTSSPTPEQLQHMIQFREQLEHKLGDLYALSIKPGTEEQRTRGQELYLQICAPCHGVRGRGDGHTAQGLIGNPSDLTDAEQASFYSEQARLYILRKGVDGTPMMGWENVLTEADIMAVYLYIRSLIKRK